MVAASLNITNGFGFDGIDETDCGFVLLLELLCWICSILIVLKLFSLVCYSQIRAKSSTK